VRVVGAERVAGGRVVSAVGRDAANATDISRDRHTCCVCTNLMSACVILID
jgi:hypothetical protein